MRRTAQGSAFAAVDTLLRQRDVVILLSNAFNPVAALPAFIRSIADLGPGATTGALAKTAENTAGLLTYEVGNFTPVATFLTPGTLSVVYVTQTGIYLLLGRLFVFYVNLRFTPTLGTASGDFIVTGFPFTPIGNTICGFEMGANAVTYTAATATQACGLLTSTPNLRIRDQGSADALQGWTTTQVTNGVERDFRFSGVGITTA